MPDESGSTMRQMVAALPVLVWAASAPARWHPTHEEISAPAAKTPVATPQTNPDIRHMLQLGNLPNGASLTWTYKFDVSAWPDGGQPGVLINTTSISNPSNPYTPEEMTVAPSVTIPPAAAGAGGPVDVAIQATWKGFKDAIRRGDDAAAKAQFSVDPNAQEFVAEFLGNLTPNDRANIDAILPPIEPQMTYGDPAFALFAVYATADKVTAGVPDSHPVTYILDPDGVWRIYTF